MSKLRIVIFIFLTLLVVSGWLVSRKNGKTIISSQEKPTPTEEEKPIRRPTIKAVPLEKQPGLSLTFSELTNVDRLDFVLTYEWHKRPEQYIVSERLAPGQREFTSTIRFESCSGNNCILHQVARGKIKLTLSNTSGGKWEEDFEFKIEKEKAFLERGDQQSR